jgi:predicted phosphodiesterase
LVSADASIATPWVSEPDAPDRIGIMADSHGKVEMIVRAAAVLQSRGCAMCIHLGDIIDTTLPGTIDACLHALGTGRIKAIRGNNEHTLLLNRSSWLDRKAMDVIRSMPLGRRIGSALLTHSLPFDDALGARCMLEDLDAGHLMRFFTSYPETLLFRGHSHRSAIVQMRKAALFRRPLPAKHPFPLPDRRPAVITCGALADGLCLIWDRQQQTLELITLGAV